jgi:hypothetical protein
MTCAQCQQDKPGREMLCTWCQTDVCTACMNYHVGHCQKCQAKIRKQQGAHAK